MNARRILVVAAHPDDETLGCGGTIARHADEGDEVRVLFLADGVGARGISFNDPACQGRKSAAHAAAETLGIREVQFLGLPDNRLDSVDLLDVVKPIELIVQEFRPLVIYTHHGGDLNVDHRISHEAVLTACRPQPGSSVSRILFFETPSSTEWADPSIGPAFRPTCYVGIAEQMSRKMAALHHYEGEMRPFPHARSLEAIEALARTRGCAAGLPAAEAFVILREIRP